MSFAFSIKKKAPIIAKKVDSDSGDEDDGPATKKQKTGAPPPPPSDIEQQKVADKLADFVAKNGAQFEEMTRSKNPPAPENPFRFLHDKDSATYKYYQWKLAETRRYLEEQKARVLSILPALVQRARAEASIKARVPEAYPAAQRPGLAPGGARAGIAPASRPPPERERANRFSEHPPERGPSAAAAAAASTSGSAAATAASDDAAAAEAAARAKADSVRLMEMYMRKAAQSEAEREREEQAERDRQERIRLGEDPRFKADGTRAHHMGDYIPQEELAKFMGKECAPAQAKTGDKAAAAAVEEPQIQIGEDNKGRQLLAKMGWTEGAGLGAGGSGITAPVQAGAGNQRGLGIGAEKAEEVTEDDDIYAQYKKRMMLGYKFRPNPLNNPRKAYY